MSVCVNCVNVLEVLEVTLTVKLLEVLEVPSPVELFSEAIVKSKDSGVDQFEQDRPCNLFSTALMVVVTIIRCVCAYIFMCVRACVSVCVCVCV